MLPALTPRAACILLQGLALFPVVIIIPCLQLFRILFGVVSGIIYFQEYRDMGLLQHIMFALGVVVSGKPCGCGTSP